ncbi:MAG: serine/threonine-protein kinase M1 [Watsoniomyces obsoletus]|nr:MAG: serine/threonine-protein kinase M1 [Watsoniomyces obsoletus]
MAQSTPPSTTETLLLPLRVWPKGDPNKKSLPSLIQRINEQRGPFRGVTEASLEEEIRAQEARAAQPDEDIEDETGDDQANKPENEVGRREVLLKAKEDILKQVGQAYMEAYYALDFVSLLLSKDSPRQAELSMSQHLKQHVPMGSLGMEKVQPQPERLQDIKDREMVQLGWKMQSLQSTADSLLAAATRLETEVQHETQYWEQVLAIDNERWSLCRMPRERHTLGVRFGFLEAAAEFRDRGLGALRRGEGGKIILDQGLATSIPRVVRVRIETRAGGITSSSTVPTLANPDTSPIEELILQARNAIYEEELFHEITRETRLLMNQGVRNTDSVIILTLPDRRRVLIDLVPLEDYHHLPQQPPEQSQSQGGENGRKKEHVENNPKSYLAEGIALSLRLLLSHTHRQHFLQRSQIPPPLTDRKRTQPPPAIIRPVLSHLMHRSVITFLDEFLKGVEEALDSAGLNASHTVIMGNLDLASEEN